MFRTYPWTRLLHWNVQHYRYSFDWECLNYHEFVRPGGWWLLEEVISQRSTHFFTEMSQYLDTTVKIQTDVNHTLLELSANDSLMAYVSSHKKLFIALYDNTISTSEKIESKHWTKFHAAIHSYISTESFTSSLKELFKRNPSIVQNMCVVWLYRTLENKYNRKTSVNRGVQPTWTKIGGN